MNELLQKLKAADRVCQSANEHYVKADQIESPISELSGKIKKAKTKWIIIGIVAWAIIAYLLESMARHIPFLGDTFMFIMLAVVVVLSIICYRKEKEAINSKIAKIQEQAQAERNIAQQIFENNIATMEFLPSDYWYPLATEYLIKAIQIGRASTLPEAIDKFEEQLHRWKIEEANSQMLAMQQQQTAYLSSIKTSSKVSAAANVANAFINLSSKM